MTDLALLFVIKKFMKNQDVNCSYFWAENTIYKSHNIPAQIL